jgi:FMN reductase
MSNALEPPIKTSSVRPLIVGLGGTTRTGSTSERAVRIALEEAERQGAQTIMFPGPELDFPNYAPENPIRSAAALRLIEALRKADGIIVGSPGYHGSLSGLVKNALDYVEDMRTDRRSYFDGRSVGLIACAYGWQATGTTLTALRSIVHALRGWPTPLGVAINSASGVFDKTGELTDEATRSLLHILAGQVMEFATAKLGQRSIDQTSHGSSP